MDEIFDTLNELYVELHGGLANTGGQLLDWAVNSGLISGEQRDYYYRVGGI